MQVHDHVGRAVCYPFPPKRIISLCPAITETLFLLGLKEEIVGRTQYCIFPVNEVASVPTVGGTKQIQLQKIIELQPDLIICEKEENTKEMVEQLAAHFPVYVAQVESVDDAYRMIRDIGAVVHRLNEANTLVEQITEAFSALPKHTGRVAYMMWRKPYMVVGAPTYIDSVLTTLGFTNPFAHVEGRYPAVTVDDLQQAQLDVLLLSSEPFPFSDKHVKELAVHLPNTRIVLVDGEMFWYGARMQQAAHYFQQFLS